jgi:hypothetical protein
MPEASSPSESLARRDDRNPSAVGPAVIASVLPRETLRPRRACGRRGVRGTGVRAGPVAVREDATLGEFFDAGVEECCPCTTLPDVPPAVPRLPASPATGPSGGISARTPWRPACSPSSTACGTSTTPTRPRPAGVAAGRPRGPRPGARELSAAEAQATLRMATDSACRFAAWRELKANCIKVLNERLRSWSPERGEPSTTGGELCRRRRARPARPRSAWSRHNPAA